MSFRITVDDVTVLVPTPADRVSAEGEEEGGHHYGVDDQGNITSEHPLFPPWKELLLGGGAAVLIIALLAKFAGPMIKKGLADRTAKIQGELDASAAAKANAETEAARIRQALGDIQGERQRLLADADAQAEALLADGRSRLATEVAELEAKADADIATAAGRSSDELRNEIARRAAAAADRVVADSLDEATQQRLIEDFIQKVGASS